VALAHADGWGTQSPPKVRYCDFSQKSLRAKLSPKYLSKSNIFSMAETLFAAFREDAGVHLAEQFEISDRCGASVITRITREKGSILGCF